MDEQTECPKCVAIRAEVEAQRPTAEEAASTCAEWWRRGKYHPVEADIAAAITHEREVAAARELALKAERDEAVETLTATEASHQDEEAAHAETLALLERIKARADAAEKALAEARAVIDSTEVMLAQASVTLRRFREVHEQDRCSGLLHTGMCASVGLQLKEIEKRLLVFAALASTPAPPPAQPDGTWQKVWGGSLADAQCLAAQAKPAPLPPEVRAALRRLLSDADCAGYALAVDLALLAPLAEEPTT